MAKKVTVTLVDDFDGAGAADETVEFGLDGVTYEIEQDLAKAIAIADKAVGNVLFYLARQFHALLVRSQRQRTQGLVQHRAEREIRLFRSEEHTSELQSQ